MLIKPEDSLLMGRTFTVFVHGFVQTNANIQEIDSVNAHVAFCDVSIPITSFRTDNTPPKIESFKEVLTVLPNVSATYSIGTPYDM